MSPLEPADRLALQDLAHRYAAYVDDRDLDRAAGLFALDGVLVRPDRRGDPDEVVGRAAIRAALGVLDDLPVTAHELVGQIVDRTGPHAAEGRVACVAHHVRPAAGGDHVWHLVYRDSYRRLDGHWLFARRALEIRFTEDREIGR